MNILRTISELRNFKTLSLPLIVGFLLITVVNTQDGGQNARTRIAAMRAMHEQRTFRIDSHIGATGDWSQTPDGAYYSNKAPGPMLYGFPIFLALDRLHMLRERGYRDERGLREFPDYLQMTGTSLIMQAIPFALLGAYLVHVLAGIGVSFAAQGFVLIALFFGNTAAVYMSSYFGHGITAVFILGALLALIQRRYVWLSFCFGSAQLCDYGVGMQIPGVVAALGFVLMATKREERGKELSWMVRGVFLGALVPGILWIWYHTVTFGGPLDIANKFQNPGFLDMKDQAVQLWGIFSLPRWDIFGKLLVGPERGILVTQPWLLAAIPFGLLAAGRGIARAAAAFCVIGLAGLLFMNASFGGWHGGGSAGPRYMSHIFPAFALWLGLFFDRLPRWGAGVLWISLGGAVLFRSLVYSSTIEAPSAPIWNFYFGEVARRSWTPIFRVYLFWLILWGAGIWIARRWGRET